MGEHPNISEDAARADLLQLILGFPGQPGDPCRDSTMELLHQKEENIMPPRSVKVSPLQRPGSLLAVPPIHDWSVFDAYHAHLKGAPGARVSRYPERLETGRRARYEHGTIYERAVGRLAWVYGAINDRYDALGGPASWLGYPVSDEEKFDDQGGRVSYFERGAIYWWVDVGAIELDDVVVHYTGIVCFGETDELSAADEPYVVLGVLAPAATQTRTQIYEDVDAGDSRPDLVELYRGKPNGIVMNALLMEHDQGDPDKYKGVMVGAVAAAAAAASTAAGVSFPVLAPIFVLAAPVIKDAAEALGEALSGALGTGDDKLGSETIQLSAKQMVVLAGRTPNWIERGVGFKISTPLMGADEGASYKAYFGLVPA